MFNKRGLNSSKEAIQNDTFYEELAHKHNVSEMLCQTLIKVCKNYRNDYILIKNPNDAIASRLLEALSTLSEIHRLDAGDGKDFQNKTHCYYEIIQCFVIALQEILLQVKSKKFQEKLDRQLGKQNNLDLQTVDNDFKKNHLEPITALKIYLTSGEKLNLFNAISCIYDAIAENQFIMQYDKFLGKRIFDYKVEYDVAEIISTAKNIL
jgi:hypothetical protein